MKKAIKYLRFSSNDQSQHSIERQEIVIAGWAKYGNVQLIDSFEDKGYSARTFDRPDVKALFDFIRKNYRQIDYLVVSELTRFSRETGDAINMVKKIQTTYGIKIVSASRNIVYDCHDSNSFFMMGLEFLLGNSENIKRTTDINGGIYTAKTEKGKWIRGGKAPYGYTKQYTDGKMALVIDDAQAAIVRFIFDAYLNNMPAYLIKQEATERGFTRTSNDAVGEILRNPLYMGYQQVKAWKDNPGGLFQLKNFTPIVSEATWYHVQEKLNYSPKVRATLDNSVPLRGVLKCHCSRMLTAAPSRSRNGNYYYYYKCHSSGHNNISAIKAHTQLNEMLKYLSIPDRLAAAIRIQSESLLEDRQKENRKVLATKQRELEQAQNQMTSLEEKWINNQMQFETYNRWHGDLNEKRMKIAAHIETLSKDQNQLHLLLQVNIESLTDMQHVYNTASTTDKQELIKQVFDKSLYYKTGIYRTAFLMPVFCHNELILKQKQLLIIDRFGRKSGDVEVTGLLSNHLFDFLSFVQSIRVA